VTMFTTTVAAKGRHPTREVLLTWSA